MTINVGILPKILTLKKMKNFKKLGFTVILLLLVSFAFSQGNTNSSLSGKVEDKDGTLPGASVLVVHTPWHEVFCVNRWKRIF